MADSVRAEKEVYEMTVGAYDQIRPILSPARSKVGVVSYKSSDGSIVAVSGIGTLKAMAPGRATITVKTETSVDTPEGCVVHEITCGVIVSEKKDDGGDPDGIDPDRADPDSGGDKGGKKNEVTPDDRSSGSRSGIAGVTEKGGRKSSTEDIRGSGRGADTGDGSAFSGLDSTRCILFSTVRCRD